MAADALLRFRPEFPILEKTTYLISSFRASGDWNRWTDRPALVT